MTPEEREAWLERPAMDPPPGVKSNFDNPESFRVKSLAMMISLLIVVTLVFVGWVFTKVRVAKKLHIEDYIITLAYVSRMCT